MVTWELLRNCLPVLHIGSVRLNRLSFPRGWRTCAIKMRRTVWHWLPSFGEGSSFGWQKLFYLAWIHRRLLVSSKHGRIKKYTEFRAGPPKFRLHHCSLRTEPRPLLASRGPPRLFRCQFDSPQIFKRTEAAVSQCRCLNDSCREASLIVRVCSACRR